MQALIVDDIAGDCIGDFFKSSIGRDDIECTVVSSITALKTAFKPDSQFHWLFINTHFGLASRSAGGVLPLIEEIVTKAENNPSLILYGFEKTPTRLFGKDHPLLGSELVNTWSYLPMPALAELMSGAITKADTANLDLRRKRRAAVAQDWASRLDCEIRHKMAGATAAVRILNGALRSGDYDLQDNSVRVLFDAAFKSLREACIRSGISDLQADIGELILAARIGAQAVEERPEKTRKAQATEGKTQQKKELLPRRQLLIVDDEKAVWEPVWKFLLNTDIVSFATTGEDALTMVQSSGHTYDAVILDLDLGNGSAMNGIEVLQRIKHTHLDLPVVVATATHHAEFAKQCMRLGASGYFLKELVETVKDSIQYYETLRKVVTSQLSAASPERKIWRRFVKLQDKVDVVDSNCHTAIGSSFRKAYYLLTLEEGHVIPKTLLVPPWPATEPSKRSGQYDGAMFQAQNAADQAMIASIMKRDRSTYDEAQSTLFGFTEDGNGKRTYHHFGERCRRAGFSILPGQLTWIEQRPLGNGEHRHYFYGRNSQPLSKNKAIKGIEDLLTILQRLPEEKESSSSSAPPPELTRLELPVFLALTGRSHADISVDGAKAFGQGLVNGGLNLNGARVLFIDDEGERSAWWKPLQRSFTGWEGVIEYAAEVPANTIRTYDLVLLDLVHNGDPDQGIRFLDDIRQRDIALPVIVLTAADDAYYCRKALVHGANEYFLKEPLPDMTDEQFFGTFRSLIKRWLGDKRLSDFRRRYWSDLETLQRSNFWLPPLDKKNDCYERIKLKRSIPRASNAEVLQFIRDMVAFPFREAFFHYLLETSREGFVDAWRVSRLVCVRPDIEVALAMGQLVECLMQFNYDTNHDDPCPQNLGYLIGELDLKPCVKKDAWKLWKIRTQAKAQKDVARSTMVLLKSGMELALSFARPPFRPFQADVKASIEDCVDDWVMVEFELDGVNWPAVIKRKHFWNVPSVGKTITVRYVAHGNRPDTGADWIELAESPPGDYRGVVDYYDSSKGRGFIKAEIGPKAFVYRTQVKNNALAQGDRVTFNVVLGERGWQAMNVRKND